MHSCSQVFVSDCRLVPLQWTTSVFPLSSPPPLPHFLLLAVSHSGVALSISHLWIFLCLPLPRGKKWRRGGERDHSEWSIIWLSGNQGRSGTLKVLVETTKIGPRIKMTNSNWWKEEKKENLCLHLQFEKCINFKSIPIITASLVWHFDSKVGVAVAVLWK